MTYPIDSLVIIAPLIFILMMIAFPLIGLAVGWKRALYWGGGNFLFYTIGLIVWKCAGGAIGAKIADLLKQMIPELSKMDPTKLATSVAAPVFFILVVLVANIILLINYYAWFKRVAKIKFDIQARKALKAAKKELKEKGKSMPKVLTATTKDGVKVTEKAYGIRAGNRVIGLATMPLLMLPVTASLTTAIYMTTTTSSTRAKNKFAKGLYESLINTDAALSWFSYYNGESADDFDSLFSALQLSTEKTQEDVTFTNPETGQEETIIAKGTDVITVVTEKVPEMVADVTTSLPKLSETELKKVFDEAGTATEKKEAVEKKLAVIAAPVNKLAITWNALVDNCQEQIQAIFNSSSVTELIKQFIEGLNLPSKLVMTTDLMTQVFGELDTTTGKRSNGLYQQILRDYQSGKESGEATITFSFTWDSKKYDFNFKMTYIKALMIKLSSYNNIKQMVMDNFVDIEQLSAVDKKIFDEAADEIIGLILQAKE